jgi:hypothetical protein
MTDNNEKTRDEIMKFALGELKKTMDNIKQGKTPMVSPELKKLLKTLSEAAEMVEQDKISEQDMDNVLKEVAKKVNKKKV